MFDRTVQSITGYGDNGCRSGFQLLSCGFLPIASAHSRRSFSIPTSSTTCSSYADEARKQNFVVQCSNLVRGFQIVSSPGVQTGLITTICPLGTYVVGCHMVIYQDSAQRADFGAKYYPTNDGRSCICSNQDGARCVSSCASNANNYEVATATGSGTFQVSCSPLNSVFGCGIYPDGNTPADILQSTAVVNSTACQCYDYNGATCYAICGQLFWREWRLKGLT